MRVTIGLASVGDDVYIVAGRDELEVQTAFKQTLKGIQIDSITVGDVKVGRVYKNLSQPVYLHSGKGELQQ